MQAVQMHSYGAPDVLTVENGVSEPPRSDGHVLVRVKAVSLNPFDARLRSGAYRETIPLTFPVIPAGDFSGIVTAVDGVPALAVGDEVYGTAAVVSGGSGALAETASVRGTNVAKKPNRADFPTAAALPLVGSSAVQAIEDHIRLTSGQKILIHGGAGGIGHIAVQLARSIGAYVAATARTEDAEYLRSIGADEIIDYRKNRFEESVRGMDAVFDTVGGDTTNRSFAVIKSGGILVTMVGQPDQDAAAKAGIRTVIQGTKNSTDHLSRLAVYVDAGKITVRIARTLPLSDIRSAYTLLESGVRGKVVVTV